MIALVPCPDLLKSSAGGANLINGVHEGFWLVSQDPSVIQAAGSHAILGESIAAIREKIDRDHNLPSGFTITVEDELYNWQWADRSSNYGSAEQQRERREMADVAAKYVRTPEHNSNKWIIVKLCATPQTTQDLDEYKILVEARGHPKGIITQKFKLPADMQTQVYKNEYVISHVRGDYRQAFVRVTYDPKRAKRLHTIRARNMNKGLRKPKRTCFDHMIDMLTAIRKVVYNEHIGWLYIGHWSGRGIDQYSRAIAHFYELAVMMNKKSGAQKALAPHIKPLWVHQSVMRRTASEKFLRLYDKELKRLGGPPANTERYMTRQKVIKKGEVTLPEQAKVHTL